MRALRLATVAASLFIISIQTPTANAQIFDTGVGVCRLCGHSELDTQRYVNSFLNQMFFPRSALRSGVIAADLYLLTATYTMYGRLSPDPSFSSVTVSITSEIKNVLPTGKYHVTVTTPGGVTSTEIYAIGRERFSVMDVYEPGARRVDEDDDSSDVSVASGGSGVRSGPPIRVGSQIRGGSRGPAKCTHLRREDRRNETIVWCSVD
jgi:hypothetical protein